MKKKNIKTHLKPYSIFQRRKTTINHAFASALAPNDNYDEQIIDKALRLLGENPDEHLNCVYCEAKADTWDHLVGLVKDSELRGYGHQIGNLVPCCKNCNSRKGSNDWQQFIQSEIQDEPKRKAVEARLATYLEQYAKLVDIDKIKKEMPKELARYTEIRKQILELMKEADSIAEKIRNNGG